MPMLVGLGSGRVPIGGRGAEPVEDDGQGSVLEAAVPAAVEGALAGAGDERHNLGGVDILADRACLLSAGQELANPVLEGVDGADDLDVGAGGGQQVDD